MDCKDDAQCGASGEHSPNITAAFLITNSLLPFGSSSNDNTVWLFSVPDVQLRAPPGSDALHGQFPHQVSLQNAKGHFCSASVIHPLHLLTAAHCLTNYKPGEIRVVTGALDLKRFNGSEQFRKVRHVIKHENWNETTWNNDIALVILNESLVFDNFTQPIGIHKRGATGKGTQFVW